MRRPPALGAALEQSSNFLSYLHSHLCSPLVPPLFQWADELAWQREELKKPFVVSVSLAEAAAPVAAMPPALPVSPR
jgi:hypothetical protein